MLAAVLRTDHTRLLALLDELALDTDTGGARQDLARQLLDTTHAHIDAEARVVRPAVRDVLGAAVARELRDDTDRLFRHIETARQLSGDPSAWIAELRHAVESHRELLDQAIMPALDCNAPARMVALGYQFGRELEAASRRGRVSS